MAAWGDSWLTAWRNAWGVLVGDTPDVLGRCNVTDSPLAAAASRTASGILVSDFDISMTTSNQTHIAMSETAGVVSIGDARA